LVAVTEQVPVPLIMVIKAPPEVFEQAPDAANVTAPVPLPPDDPTVKFEPFICGVPGIPVTVNVVWFALIAVPARLIVCGEPV
jgi:hypothetical protein